MFELEKIAEELANDGLQGFEIERIAKALNGEGNGFEIERIANSVKGGSGSGSGSDNADIKDFIEGKFTTIENNASVIRAHCFYQCNITSASFPECELIKGYVFQYCSSLTTANFPKCTQIGTSAFNSCEALSQVSFPKCYSVGSYAFANCTSLESINLPECVGISNYAFVFCSSLKSVYLTASSVVSLANSAAFDSTHASLAVYVPASLYSDYITANNWSNMSSRIVSVAT